MRRSHAAAGAVVIIGVSATLWVFWSAREPPLPGERSKSVSVDSGAAATTRSGSSGDREGPKPVVPGVPALVPLPPVDPSDPSTNAPLANELLKPNQSAQADLEIVLSLFSHYLELNGGLPVGTNPEIVNALTGNNPLRIAFIPRDHPAISSSGEMVDRWGSPLFFHNVARDQIEIRSAGPDREMYSPDDLVTATPGLEAGAVSVDPSSAGE